MKRQLLILATLSALSASAQWRFCGLGSFHGDAELRLGAKLGRDVSKFQNLQFRFTSEVAPWLRGQVVTRWSNDGNAPSLRRANLDEGYLQSSGGYSGGAFALAVDAKVGQVRYLHYPYPDEIAMFDQVPGIGDIDGGPATDYRGAIGTFEATHGSGLGVHVAAIRWGSGDRRGANAIEDYAFFRTGSSLRLELRAGGIANRVEPLGQPARTGFDVFVGKDFGPIGLGLLYEKRQSERAFTGISLHLATGAFTQAAGAVTLDYQRQDEGYSAEVSVARLRFGEHRTASPGDELVGEVHATRLRTLWQGGYNRNQAEFVTSSWGGGDKNTYVVAEEKPWRLETEALVSQHTNVGSSWLRDRQGPGQFRQDVIYRVYRRSPHFHFPLFIY